MVGTALESPSVGLSNAHSLVGVPLIVHFIFGIMHNELIQANIQQIPLPK